MVTQLFSIFSIQNAIPPALQGGIWTVFFYALCFFGVVVCKLVKRGWNAQDAPKKPKQNTAPPDEKTKPSEKAQEKKAPEEHREPIYYIVERRSRRKPKNCYNTPKEIRFK